MTLEFSRQILEKKFSHIEFHECPSSGSQGVACRQINRWTDEMKLIFAFCNFANAPKIDVSTQRQTV
jgi:hypothetical protein